MPQQLVGANALEPPDTVSEPPGAVCALPVACEPPLVAYEPLVDAVPRLAVYALLLPASELLHFAAAVFAHLLAGLTVLATVNEIHAIFIGDDCIFSIKPSLCEIFIFISRNEKF